MALGHPIGATGSLLIGTLLDELERREEARPRDHVRRRHGAGIIIERDVTAGSNPPPADDAGAWPRPWAVTSTWSRRSRSACW